MRIDIKPTKILLNFMWYGSVGVASVLMWREIWGIKHIFQDVKNNHFIYQDKIKKENES